MTNVPPVTRERAFWERTLPGWHVAFYAALALATVFVLSDGDLTTGDRVAALGLAALMAASYTVLGRDVLGAEQVNVPVICYLLSVWLPFLVLVGLSPGAFLLLFVWLPQTWAILPTRAAAVWVVVVSVALFVTGLMTGRSAGQLAIESAVNLGFSLLLGLWITGIIHESVERNSSKNCRRHVPSWRRRNESAGFWRNVNGWRMKFTTPWRRGLRASLRLPRQSRRPWSTIRRQRESGCRCWIPRRGPIWLKHALW
jgi:hypothetical protein